MIRITIQNMAVIEGLNSTQLAKIKSIFSISNPLFSRKAEMGLSLWGVQHVLKYYNSSLFKDKLIIPIGGLSEVLEYLGDDVIIIDNRSEKSDSDYFSKFQFSGTLRKYQTDILDKLKDTTVGVIEAMTGSGKTVTFVKKIFDLKQNTLIIVNTLELANQAIEALIEFSNLTKEHIGLIGNGKHIIKPITVAIHQTLMHLDQNEIDNLNNSFGAIIADEVHICAADQFYKNLTSLTMKYKYGFSATPEDRADGLSQVVFWATGPLLHVVPKDALSGSLIVPTLKVVNTDYYFPLFDTSDYTFMMIDMALDKKRNQKIAEYLITNYDTTDDYVCVLCNQVSQVEALTKLLGPTASLLTSKLPKKQRLKIMNDLLNKKIKYIVSTYSLFSTGINVKHLNILALAAPRKSIITLKQSAGRIMRTDGNKKSSTIIDFVDNKIELLRGQAKKRHKILINLGK